MEHPERQEGADGKYMGGVVSPCIFHFFVATEWSGSYVCFGGVIGGKREEKGKKREDGKGEFE